MNTFWNMHSSVVLASNKRHRLVAFKNVDLQVVQPFLDGGDLAGSHGNECRLMHEPSMQSWDTSASLWVKSESLLALF